MKMPEICWAHITIFYDKMSEKNNLKGKKGEFWLMAIQGSVYSSWLHRVQFMAHGFPGFSLWLMSTQGSVYGSWLHRVQSMALGFTGFSL